MTSDTTAAPPGPLPAEQFRTQFIAEQNREDIGVIKRDISTIKDEIIEMKRDLHDVKLILNGGPPDENLWQRSGPYRRDAAMGGIGGGIAAAVMVAGKVLGLW